MSVKQTWEVTTWEIAHFESFHFGKYSWEVDARETALTVHQTYYENYMNIKHSTVYNVQSWSSLFSNTIQNYNMIKFGGDMH